MTGTGLLLDTHAAIWLSEDEEIAAEAVDALNEAANRDWAVVVSPISAWEIGMLVSRGRLALTREPSDWFARFLENGSVSLAGMAPSVLIASNFLPGQPPRDPADRIIAATAREGGFRLITRDSLLLAYGEAGHVRTIRC